MKLLSNILTLNKHINLLEERRKEVVCFQTFTYHQKKSITFAIYKSVYCTMYVIFWKVKLNISKKKKKPNQECTERGDINRLVKYINSYLSFLLLFRFSFYAMISSKLWKNHPYSWSHRERINLVALDL